MSRNPALDVVMDELARIGIRKPTVDDSGEHLKIKWWHRGRPRVVVVARTASDHRAPLNNRALVRRILREDGYNLDDAPKQSPRVAQLEKAMNVPDPADGIILDRVKKLENEIKTLTDLLLGIAPAFDNIMGDVENIIGDRRPASFKIKMSLNPKRLGLALAALYSAGFNPSDIDINALGNVVEPTTIAPAASSNGAHRGKRDGSKKKELLEMLQQKPMTTAQLAELMSITKVASPEYNALGMRLSTLKKDKLIDNDGRGTPWRVIPHQTVLA